MNYLKYCLERRISESFSLRVGWCGIYVVPKLSHSIPYRKIDINKNHSFTLSKFGITNFGTIIVHLPCMPYRNFTACRSISVRNTAILK